MSDIVRRSTRIKSQEKRDTQAEMQETTEKLKLTPVDSAEKIVTIIAPEDDRASIASHRSNQLSTNSVSAVRRQKLAIQLEYARKKKEQDEKLLDMEMELKLAEIDEENDNMSIIAQSVSSQRAKVESWMNKESSKPEIHPQLPPSVSTNVSKCTDLNRILSRQSLSKELPIFHGDPTEWSNFICQFRNSTTACGFTNEENQYRLQKCLKGKAREIVNSLLILPKNVEKVISVLEKRFGKSEYIISMLLERVKRMLPFKEDKLDTLIDFSDAVNNLVYTLKTLNENDHLRNPLLLQELLNKLPNSYKMRWIRKNTYLKQNDVKLEKFQEWLTEQADAACELQIPYMSNTENKHLNSSKFQSKNVFVTNKVQNNQNSYLCCCCNLQSHHLSKCPQFISRTVDERWKFVTEKHICFSCLLLGHSIKNCRNKDSCNINGCKRPHHKLLHAESKNDRTISTELSKEKNKHDVMETNCHTSQSSSDILLKILPVKLSSKTGSIDTFALLDDASTVTLIDDKMARDLGLDGPEKPLQIQWTNEEIQQNSTSKVVNLTISGKKSKSFYIRNARTIKGLSLPTQVINMEKLIKKYPYLNTPDISKAEFIGKPMILIGQDNWPLLVNRKAIYGPWQGPALSKTILGWVVHGNTGNFKNVSCHSTCHVYQEKDNIDILHDMVKEQWKIENFGIKSITNTPLSKQDVRAQTILDSTMKRVGDRYETGLLWKEDNIIFPESQENAFRRLKCTERKMDRDEEYAKAYCNKFDDLVNKGYLRKLTTEETTTVSPKIWYLPHFGVVNPNKPNKLRIVFDAASKSNGVSLNDKLLTGPDLYNSLLNILLNFRIKKIAFVADIKEMFLQVMVRKEDQCAQRILWRGMDRKQNPDIYEIQVVFFGSTCGPCLAQEAKNKNACCFKEKYPKAANAIIKQHYMDDYLGGADNEEEAIELINNVIKIHKKGGFIICNWISNSMNILKKIEPTLTVFGEKNIGKISENNDIPSERVFGLWWNPTQDNFNFQTKFHNINKDVLNGNRRPSKREILKVVMSIFDPLGFLAHFFIQGKILLQEIWRCKLGWDDEITEALNIKWQRWLDDLRNINKFRISRQYTTLNLKEQTIIRLHIFCDASEDGYAAVAYFQFIENDKKSTSFVCARTRVTPLKAVSIPRLELQAALMGARLGNSLKQGLDLEIEKTMYWADSHTVLHWIKSEARRFKVFVAQRVGEIQELTNADDWNYVTSRNNVADEATKRTSNQFDFTHNSRWINGPEFLLFDNLPVYKQKEVQPEILEIRNNCVTTITIIKQLSTPEPNSFSKWYRILRSTAWMLRFIRRCQKKQQKNDFSYELQPEELQNAEELLCKRIQADSFLKEISILQAKKQLPNSSRLFFLSCILNEDGLIRMNGRLNNCTIINELTKNPIILDPRHHLTKLLIKQYHANANHLGREMVINELRQKYWIINIRQAVKKAWFDCQTCKIHKSLPNYPIMGQLPQCRIEPTIRPFIKTGVDYFGPIQVTVKRGHEKRYGVIFTCMVTRAIHLEIANDLSTNGFIHVYRQFGCRRGFPEEMYSDNGKNFKGANRELKKALEDLNQDEIVRNLSLKNTKWNFNPPLAPHMGGTWERLIQIVKKNISEVLKERYPQEYVLRTLFAEIENIINSRPLTHVSVDPDDTEALTPNHFLIGPSYTALPCVETDNVNLCLLSKWRAVQRLADEFWKRWTREYLPTLLTRNKWKLQQKQVTIDDIVVVVDPDGPRNMWPMGKIICVYPGKDGIVRVVDVKTAAGTYRRPVTKICVLPVKE